MTLANTIVLAGNSATADAVVGPSGVHFAVRLSYTGGSWLVDRTDDRTTTDVQHVIVAFRRQPDCAYFTNAYKARIDSSTPCEELNLRLTRDLPLSRMLSDRNSRITDQQVSSNGDDSIATDYVTFTGGPIGGGIYKVRLVRTPHDSFSAWKLDSVNFQKRG